MDRMKQQGFFTNAYVMDQVTFQIEFRIWSDLSPAFCVCVGMVIGQVVFDKYTFPCFARCNFQIGFQKLIVEL